MSQKPNMGVFQLHMYKLHKCQQDSNSLNECLKEKMCTWLQNSFFQAFNADLEDARSFIGVFSLTVKDLWQDISTIKCDICPTLASFKLRKDKKWHHNQKKEIDALRFVQLTVELYNYLNREVDFNRVADLTRRTIQQYRKLEEEVMGEFFSKIMRPQPYSEVETSPVSEAEDSGSRCSLQRHTDSPQSESSSSVESGNEYCEQFPGLPSHEGPSHLGHRIEKLGLSEPAVASDGYLLASSNSVWYRCKQRNVDELCKDFKLTEKESEMSCTSSVKTENNNYISHLDCPHDGAIICSTHNELCEHLNEIAQQRKQDCLECDALETEVLLSAYKWYNVFGNIGEKPTSDNNEESSQDSITSNSNVFCTETFFFEASDAGSLWSSVDPSQESVLPVDIKSAATLRQTCIHKLLEFPDLFPCLFHSVADRFAVPLTCMHQQPLLSHHPQLSHQFPSTAGDPSPFLVPLGTSDSLFCSCVQHSSVISRETVVNHLPAIPRRLPVHLVQEATTRQTEKMRENTFLIINPELSSTDLDETEIFKLEQHFLNAFDVPFDLSCAKDHVSEELQKHEFQESVSSVSEDSFQSLKVDVSWVKTKHFSPSDLLEKQNLSTEKVPSCQYFNDDDTLSYFQQDIMLKSFHWARLRAFRSQLFALDFNTLLSSDETSQEYQIWTSHKETCVFKNPQDCECGGYHKKWHHHGIPKEKYWKDPVLSSFMIMVCKDYYETDPDFYRPLLDIELEISNLLMPEEEPYFDMQDVPPMPSGVLCEDIERDVFASTCYRQLKNKGKRPLHPNKPCSFFLEGCCYRSDCKYSHDLSTITCHFWKEGHCFKGDLCPFLHGYNLRRHKNDNSKQKFEGTLRSRTDVPDCYKKDIQQTNKKNSSGCGVLALKRKKINRKFLLFHDKSECIS